MEFPIQKFFVTLNQEFPSVHAAISTDLTFVHSGIPHEEQTPKRFYAGYDTGWGGIINRLTSEERLKTTCCIKHSLRVRTRLSQSY